MAWLDGVRYPGRGGCLGFLANARKPNLGSQGSRKFHHAGHRTDYSRSVFFGFPNQSLTRSNSQGLTDLQRDGGLPFIGERGCQHVSTLLPELHYCNRRITELGTEFLDFESGSRAFLLTHESRTQSTPWLCHRNRRVDRRSGGSHCPVSGGTARKRGFVRRYLGGYGRCRSNDARLSGMWSGQTRPLGRRVLLDLASAHAQRPQ